MKNFLDKFLACIIFVVSFIFLLIIYIIIRFKFGHPVIFKQKRPGDNSRIFTIYKFRTMSNKMDIYGNLLPDEQRITKFGKFLRSTSLDELPQLFNVLKGDMSFVGPRALLVEYLPLYSSQQKKRHLVKPGITGWSQINGRNTISWEEKLNLDIWYVENRTFLLDLKILWITVVKVIKRSDISSSNHISMEKFTGNKRSNN